MYYYLMQSYMEPHLTQTISSIKTPKRELVAQIFVVFIVPILAIYYGFVPATYRIWVLGGVMTLFILLLMQEKWTRSMLGLGKVQLKKYILPYVIFTAVAVAVTAYYGEGIGHEELQAWWTHSHFLYKFFLVSLFQEVGYRAYLIPALGKLVSKPALIVVLNAILFTFLHIIFPQQMVGLPLACIGGLGFALMYMRYPSLILIILSHSIINFFVVLFGFFVIPGVTY